MAAVSSLCRTIRPAEEMTPDRAQALANGRKALTNLPVPETAHAISLFPSLSSLFKLQQRPWFPKHEFGSYQIIAISSAPPWQDAVSSSSILEPHRLEPRSLRGESVTSSRHRTWGLAKDRCFDDAAALAGRRLEENHRGLKLLILIMMSLWEG